MQILKLSYDSLPPHLKPCFVYLSFFPEDMEIDSQYLINLWVAEGYIPQEQGQNQLDIGWSYLCHLHSLCLVERIGNMYDQVDKRFKLHDLLLNLAISIAKENQSAFNVEESFRKGPVMQMTSSYRRILMGMKSIGNGDVVVMASNMAYSASCLHTLSFSQNGGIRNIPPILLSGARVLRVLDLSCTEISSLPACVGNLKLLRILNLSGTKIAEVPECVKSNLSLRFLDISMCLNLERLPQWIGELKCLEHLDIRPSSSKKIDGSIPKGVSNLVSLQVLKIDGDNKLSIVENEFLKLGHFVNLVNLQELWIDICHEVQLKGIEDGILGTLVKMRNLTIQNYYSDEDLPHVSEKMLAMKDLEYLSLLQYAVPNWICGF
ncbi:disease resistance RPP13-like protein 4 [Cryptomeria japonica]|uniref:disease resistance RPP13-like protein 4 n=1 Tax=Cryptomeria japonica TaxID=3369 RepID=UPI0027DA41C7|nr:disease resistance RPP13-like protein 4 [Cryptomeria japonica]